VAERVDNLIRRFDLRGYLRRRRPIEAAGGKELRIDCPFCSDSGQHMYVNVERKLFHCFRCETSNNLVGFIMKVEKVDLGGAFRLVRKFSRGGPVRREPRKVTATKLSECPLPSGLVRISASRRAELPDKLLNLLEEKHVSLTTAQQLDWCWCSIGRMRNRLIIPVMSGGLMVGWLARDCSGMSKQKYMFPEGFRATDYLWGMNECLDRQSRHVVLVEGVFDALTVGLGEAVALCGKHLSIGQMSLLSVLGPEKVTVCLDGDAVPAGEAMAMNLAPMFGRVAVAYLPVLDDPCSLGPAVWEYIEEAREFSSSPLERLFHVEVSDE